MPTFPVYQRREGLSGGATGSYGSAAPFQARGRALQGLGGAIEGLGNALDKRARRIAETTEDAWFSRARAETGLQLAQQRAEGADPAALIQTLDAAQAQRTSEAPSERAAGLFGEWTLQATSALAGDAARFKAGNALDQRSADFNRARDANLEAAKFGDANAEARARDDLAGFSQWATPEEVEAQKAESERLFRAARAEHAVASDPQGFLDAIAGGHDERLNGLGDDERQGLTEQAEARLDSQRREAGAQRVADIARQSRDMLARIAAGDPAITAHAISNLGLPEQNTQKLHQALEAKQAEYAQVDDVFRRLNEGGVFDPKDISERLAVSRAYDAAAKGGDLFGDDPSSRDTALYLAGNTGVVPQAALSAMRGAFASDDPARIAAATTLAADLNEASPNALAGAGAGAIADIGTEYSRLTTEMGLSPEQAAGRLGEQVRKAGAAGPDAWIDKDGRLNITIRPTRDHLRQLKPDPEAANSAASPTASRLPDIRAAVAGAATADWAGTLTQGAGRAARRAAPVLGKGAAAVLGKVLFFLSPILDATETGGRIDREVTINGIRARVTGFGDTPGRTIEIEVDGRTFRFNGSTNRDGDIVAGAGFEIIDGEPVPLTDFAESWNRLVEHVPADSGLAMVAQSQSASGEDDDEEEEGKPGTGEGEEGAEDPPMDMGGENPLTPPDGQEPEQDPQNNRPPPPGAPRLTGRLPRRDPSDGIGPDDDDKDDPQDGNPTAPDGPAKEPEKRRQSREDAKPIAYLYGGFPIYDDETAPLPDPNDPEDPFWLRTDRYLPARIIGKTMDGQIVHMNRGAYREIRVYGGHLADDDKVRIVRTITTNNKGVRLAEIEIYDPQTRKWYSKPNDTTVFPQSWSRQRVMYEARKALARALWQEKNVWHGVSPSGVTVAFAKSANGEIVTFYPLLK